MSFAKQMAVLIGIALLACGGYFAWLQYAPATVEKGPARAAGPVVELAKAERREMTTAVDAVGTTRAHRSIDVRPLTTGRVTEVGFEAGAAVKEGAVLLRMDSEIERANLVEAEARLKEAANAVGRAQALRKRGAITASTTEKLVAELATARADRDRAARRLRDRTILAPFSGVVGFAQVEPGSRLEDGDLITTLDDLSIVEIEFSLPENKFGQIGPGQEVTAGAAAFPGRAFGGVIEQLDTRIDPIARSFKARASIANPDHTLPAGMFMHLSVVLETRMATTVPEEAIVLDGSQAFLYAAVQKEPGDWRAERRPVTIGERRFGYVEILDGVAPGDEIVTRGVQKAKDGAPLRRAPGAKIPKPPGTDAKS